MRLTGTLATRRMLSCRNQVQRLVGEETTPTQSGWWVARLAVRCSSSVLCRSFRHLQGATHAVLTCLPSRANTAIVWFFRRFLLLLLLCRNTPRIVIPRRYQQQVALQVVEARKLGRFLIIRPGQIELRIVATFRHCLHRSFLSPDVNEMCSLNVRVPSIVSPLSPTIVYKYTMKENIKATVN